MQTRWYTQAERHSHGPAVRLESGDATIAIQPRVADLAEAADRVRVEARFSRGSSRARAGTQASRTPMRSENRVAWTGDRRRWERDLHDGVQSELVSLLLRLQLAEDASPTPAAVTETFAALSTVSEAAPLLSTSSSRPRRSIPGCTRGGSSFGSITRRPGASLSAASELIRNPPIAPFHPGERQSPG